LDKNSVCSILEHTATDGKTYKTKFYNLDAIISVGYRVNSKSATQFRIWATKVLKDYLVQGYAVNQKRLLEQTKKLELLQNTINFLKNKSGYPELHSRTETLYWRVLRSRFLCACSSERILFYDTYRQKRRIR